MTFYLCQCIEPKKWQAGVAGATNKKEPQPFYFDCGDCGAVGPEIHGVLSSSTDCASHESIALLGNLQIPGPGLRQAIFCKECFETRSAGKPPRPWNPPPEPSWPELKHHEIVKRCCSHRWNRLRDAGCPASGPSTDWDQFSKRLTRRLERVLKRHLLRGGTVVEANRTEWLLKEESDADRLAGHIANRVIGFGWTVALKAI